jgi:uncharacterized phage protein (TIGR02216 family)
MSAFDWPALMRAGLRGLGLQPRDFWSLTPGELAFLLGHGGNGGALTRARLDELAAAFPDKRETGDG